MIKTKLTIYNIVNKVKERRFTQKMPIPKISEHFGKDLPKTQEHDVYEV